MGRIVAIDNVSLDGVVQDPAGDEGFSRGGWVGLIKDRPQLNKLALDEALGSEVWGKPISVNSIRRPKRTRGVNLRADRCGRSC